MQESCLIWCLIIPPVSWNICNNRCSCVLCTAIRRFCRWNRYGYGCFEMFGIHLDDNFRQPFFSHSIGEFWRRWHITLGTWMKDYVFYPFSLSKAMNKLGKFFKKHSKTRFGKYMAKALPISLADLLIFFIVGVWHGAAWKYIVYGMYNGIIMSFSSIMAPVMKKCLK
ncbi:MAG: MBOAT family O-acyltransferase [Lachnospira eligens]